MSIGNSVEDCSFVQNLLRKIVIQERTVQSQGKLYIPWVVNFCRNILTMGRNVTQVEIMPLLLTLFLS